MSRWSMALAWGLGMVVGFAGGPESQFAVPETPSEDRVYVATSADGLSWSPGTLLVEHASVPEVVFTSRGEFWTYWVDFSEPSSPGTARIGVARSTDGARWEALGLARFEGLGSFVPVDPDVVELPDGRLRMYFLGSPAPPGGNTIYSAVSSDGLTFALEPGPRFSAPGAMDPSVVRLPDGQYRMYLNQNGEITSATSPDGLRFTADPGVRIPRGGVPGAIVLPDGSVRVYACTDGISAYRSGDGLRFTLERPRVVGVPSPGGIVCDPSVCTTPAGYLMVYKYRPPMSSAVSSAAPAGSGRASCYGEDPGAPPGTSGIRNHHVYRAVSADGLLFVGEASPVLRSASVPDAVLAPDGTILLYFVNGQPGQHGIFVARGSAEGPFEVLDCVKLDGAFEPTAVDPDVALVEGDEFRLLYYANLGRPVPPPAGPNVLRAARSTDGVHFTVEGDVLEGPYTDPTAVQLPEGRWLLAVPRGEEGTSIFRADEGGSFEPVGRVTEARGTPELVVLPDGRVRMYVGAGRFYAWTSEDGGRSWTVEPGVGLAQPGGFRGAGHPSVVRLPDGRWVLFYVVVEP